MQSDLNVLITLRIKLSCNPHSAESGFINWLSNHPGKSEDNRNVCTDRGVDESFILY